MSCTNDDRLRDRNPFTELERLGVIEVDISPYYGEQKG